MMVLQAWLRHNTNAQQKSHKQGMAPPHWQHEQHQATQHSTQLDIAVRERAYFLWGSSPCLEWRVYTHNASPARRGGSPGQNAPPLWSPGSTGPGLLWCRTGKRHSPCYLQVEGGRQRLRWVKYSSCYIPGKPMRSVILPFSLQPLLSSRCRVRK